MAATSPDSPALDTAGAITVTTTDDFRFVPDTISARTGDIRVVLKNDGSYPHNLSLPDLQVTSKTVTGAPGSTTTELRLRVDKPGTYRFLCTFHDQAGMTGTLTVTS
jgi:plastocyanin